MRAFLLLISISAIFSSCKLAPDRLKKAELMDYVLKEKNGLISSVSKEGVLFQLIYRPKDLIIAQQVDVYDQAAIDSLTKSLKNYEYFILKIQRDNRQIESSFASDPNQYNALISYFTSSIGQDLHLVQGKDTVNCFQAIYSPDFGTSNASTLMLVFNYGIKENIPDVQLTYSDSFLGTGTSIFSFRTDKILNTPKLIF